MSQFSAEVDPFIAERIAAIRDRFGTGGLRAESDLPARDPLAEPSAPAHAPSLYSRGYLSLLLVAGLIGIPISAIAFGFLAAVHELEHLVWDSLPAELGYDVPPAWWAIAALGL